MKLIILSEADLLTAISFRDLTKWSTYNACMNANQTCSVFGKCGGCSLLNVPYLEQLSSKNERILQLFEGLAPRHVIRPIKGMECPFQYRNKVIAPFVSLRGKKRGIANKHGITTGMYEKGTHRVIEAPDGCLLENPVAQKIVSAIRSIMLKHDIAPYSEDAGKGFMRHAVVRIGHSSGEVLVALVTNSDEFPHSKSFCRELVRRVPAITTVVQSINTRKTNVVLGDRERVLYGPGFILDELCGLSFRISAHSFYQVNASQTEVLYETAIGFVGLSGDDTVIDAYCGTGTIGLIAASRGAVRVIGVDSAESSIRDARQSAKHNGIENVQFIAADAAEWMIGFARDAGACQNLTLMMDPPRAGSTPEFLQAASTLGPKRIVYISCNPETQARDIRQLLKAGYIVDAIQPVDMFPHTPHIETVALLTRP